MVKLKRNKVLFSNQSFLFQIFQFEYMLNGHLSNIPKPSQQANYFTKWTLSSIGITIVTSQSTSIFDSFDTLVKTQRCSNLKTKESFLFPNQSFSYMLPHAHTHTRSYFVNAHSFSDISDLIQLIIVNINCAW